MTESLFTELQAAAFREGLNPRTKKARRWFQDKAQNLGKLNKLDVISDKRLSQQDRPAPGKMMMFFYNPKTKDSLPYYDTFPLILFVDFAPGGYYGLNMHYLPPSHRAKLFDKLLETKNNSKYDESTKLNLSYNLLKTTAKYSAFRPAFKRYLTGYVKSKMVIVDAPEWPIALFLPTESFKKAGTSTVWSDSRKMI
mgnify:CR=1 FL=1